ncbi:aminodeoxychorismate synthase component I [Streptomyces sp. NPDC047017]|uniref:aminodeoxychorismate synthase component I n=1 Tax=Streptomyces sp. NPDC047017 TaxID=3155024 RepID=UPI0033FFD2C5
MKTLLVDNFDSFTLNIAQYLYEVSGTLPVVVPNTTPYEELPLGEVDAVVLSPGPGRPSRRADFGVCRDIIAACEVPVLGVCLGHQGLAEFFGARTVHAPEPVHGRVDTVRHTGTGLFAGLPQDLPVVRYHSLIATDLPDCLERTAWNGEGLVMAVAHREKPLWGVQFHPESIETRGGRELLINFLALAAGRRTGPRAAGQVAAGQDAPAAVEAFRRVGGPARLRLDIGELTVPRTPAEEFTARYAGRPHSFWLDAEGSDRPGSRYSLMGAWDGEGSVVLSYDLAGRLLTLTGEGRSEQVTGDVFELLEQITRSVDVQVPEDCPLPFQGGLVGYFGYELKALTIGNAAHPAPEPDAWFLHTRAFLVFDHRENRAFEYRLTPAVDPSGAYGTLAGATAAGATAAEVPAAAPATAAAGDPADRAGARRGYRPGPVAEEKLNLRDGRDAYLSLIKQTQQYILDGETYEVCLTNKARVPEVGDGLAAYHGMRAVSPVPYGAYLRCGGIEVLSSSPETFLRVDGNRMVESRPIKGTRPRGGTPEQDAALRRDLLASPKDRAENLMIVDLVRHDLNAVCEPGSVHVPEAFVVESYSSVHQLVSTIRGRLPWNRSALAAVRACFPGGSMTGAPKKRTMQIIDELEGEGRGIYSGALGWLSFSGSLDLSIVIRTAVVRDGAATFGVGGAITALSDPDEEFQEILVKASVPHHGLRGGAGEAP